VGIFSLSSHSVITIIMVWTPWTAPRRRAEDRGGRFPPGRGRLAADRWSRGGRPGGQLLRPSERLEARTGSSTSACRFGVGSVGICPHRGMVVHRIGPLFHKERRQNRL